MAESRFKQYTYIPQNPLPLSPPCVIPKPNSFDMYRVEKHTVVFPAIHVEDESIFPVIPVEEEIIFPVIDDGVYQPKSKRTRAAYDNLLTLIQQPLPGQPLAGQPLSTVRFVADKILEILKNDAVDYHDKRINVEMLLNPIPDHVFDQLVSVGKLITDFYGFAAGHVDGGVVDGVRSLSICSDR
ncbi:DExH-box ATP-dependent RNA helicase DExH12-like [Vicia villosa]|uniref:DExH-box ATP-dependent RNA helicase DExH12-like n=1 Tax=Vicia villosa TaxID=3911 RepID=UPI00273BA0A4|nr:DExH-box ATP-dependent RNA helicase DExH12-like [Vicia villosa]